MSEQDNELLNEAVRHVVDIIVKVSQKFKNEPVGTGIANLLTLTLQVQLAISQEILEKVNLAMKASGMVGARDLSQEGRELFKS